MHNERNKAEQEHFSRKKDTGECFCTKLKSTCKTSGTFEGKKFYSKKSLTCTSLLHQAIHCIMFYDIFAWACTEIKILICFWTRSGPTSLGFWFLIFLTFFSLSYQFAAVVDLLLNLLRVQEQQQQQQPFIYPQKLQVQIQL